MDEVQNQICISVCVKQASELQAAVSAAESQGDWVEVRLDCLPETEDRKVAGKLTSANARQVIFTLRPKHQGGFRELPLSERVRFATSFSGESWIDLELDLVEALMNDKAQHPGINWQQVICSHHDFDGVGHPDEIYRRLASTPARVLKLAFMADDATDNLIAFKLFDRAGADGRKLIALAMGEAGVVTRVLGPSRGAFLTYAAMSLGEETAPGQITVDQLRDCYRLDRIRCETALIGVVGWPIGHSVSPHIHNAAFAATETDAVFLPFAVKNLDQFITRMVRQSTRELDWNLLGLGVTAPHKTAVLDHLDWIEPAAKKVGAVNTIVVEGERLLGYNTDADAFLISLREAFVDLAGCRAAVIGSGGAARAVTYVLKKNGVDVTIAARNAAKRSELAAEFGCAELDSLNRSRGDFEIVVNTTPLGTVGAYQNESPLTREQLRGARLVYDLVYNPAETKLLSEAKAVGCKTVSGVKMLVLQAAAQFKLWTGSDAPVSVMEHAALKSLKV